MIKKKISIVTPFYNEEDSIDYYFSSILDFINKLIDKYDFEIIGVDDGSNDKTLEKLFYYQKKNSFITIIELSRNFGKEPALTAGIDQSNGDAVIPFDADLQDPVDVISILIKEWEKGYDVVTAKRLDRSNESFFKRITAQLFYKFHNYLSPIKIPENVGDFRLMDKKVVTVFKALPETQRYLKGIFAWLGFKTKSINYVRQKRMKGITKMSNIKLWNLAIEGITSFSVVPLKIWSYIGFLLSIIILIYVIFLLSNNDSLNKIEILLIITLFFGSLNFISVGILGEYIGRIYNETKRRPKYIIRKRSEILNDKKN